MGGLNVARGVRDHPLDGLIAGESASELFSGVRVRDRFGESGARHADALRGDAYAPAVEGGHCYLEALPFRAQQVAGRNLAIVERKRDCAGGGEAHLVFFASDLEAGNAALDDERRHAAPARLAARARYHYERVRVAAVCDEAFASVDYVGVALFDGASGNGSGVRACLRFGDGERAELSA